MRTDDRTSAGEVRTESDVALPYEVTLPVLGIATRFATNDRAMLTIVDEAFGVWRVLGSRGPGAGHPDPVDVRIVLDPGRGRETELRAAAPIRHAMSDDLRFVARAADGIAESDPARRVATLRVSAALAADGARFRTEMLEAAVLALLSCYDRHPLHAAAVAHRGHALLLAAPSGTGKSTLAYACHASGLDLLGDDHVRVQLEPTLRVWGWPSRLRLFEREAERLGATYAPAHELDPKRKAVVDARTGVSAARLVADDATVCVLSRDGGPLALEPLSPASVAHALDAQLAPGFDLFPARWPAVAQALAGRGGWRLNLSSDPFEAVPVVRDLLARAGRRA